jgi:hypothetical protein
MANTLLTGDVIADRMLAHLTDEVSFLDKINTQYDSYFRGRGAKVGDSVRVKVPEPATIRRGRIADLSPITDSTISVSLDEQIGVDLGATSAELALDIEDFDRDYIKPKIPDLVMAIEAAVLDTVVSQVPETVGDYGLLDDMSTVLAAGKRLDYNLAPRSGRIMLVNPDGQAQAVNAFSTLFNNQATIGKQYQRGRMGSDTLGFDWFSSTGMPTLTRGTANASYVTNGAGQTGAVLAVDTGTGTIKKGDTLTIAGVYDVHPQTKESLGFLKEFTVTADSAGGAVNLAITPAIVATGSRQNVSAAPADGVAVLVKGSSGVVYGQNLAFTKDAFYFVTADLPVPKNMEAAASRTWNGINVRFIMGYDITNDMFVSRFDVIYGGGLLRPEFAVRIPNTLS